MAKKNTWEDKKEKIDKITHDMDDAINGYFETPEQMKEYLSFMSNFYDYSPRNSAFIHSQFRGATAVGSFKFWKEKGFSVNKGEKGIQILVPNQTVPKFKDENGKWKNTKYANENERKLIDKGELEEKRSKLYFGVGHIFDVSQTTARASDLPEIFPNRWLEGEVENYSDIMNSLNNIAKSMNVSVGEPIGELGSAKGAFYHAINVKNNGHIGLNPRNGELQNVKTMIHELAHAKLHHGKRAFELSDAEKEFQAEMTAFSVASYFGIDTSDYSLGYLANWTRGKEMKDKSKLLNEVRETATEFVSSIEKELIQKKELTKGHEKLDEKEYLLMKYGSSGKIDIREMKLQDIEKEIMENATLEDIDTFNSNYKERYTLVDPETIKEPTVVIKWTEASHKLKSNVFIPFKEANEVMEDTIKNESDEFGYYKTWYSVLMPKDDGKIDVMAMDRLDLGDGYYSSPYDQIVKEKNLTEQQHKLLNNAIGIDEQQKDKNIYWYEMTARPISPGCQPKGFVDFNETKGRHGIVGYDRELTKAELEEFEMKLFKNNEKELNKEKDNTGKNQGHQLVLER